MSVSKSTHYAVLGLVAQRPTYGYALVDRLRRWPLDDALVPAQRGVYKALRALSDEHLIEPQVSPLDREPDGPSRRRYGVTPAGAQRFEEWLEGPPATWGELWLRLGAASSKDVPALLRLVTAAEHECLARLEELAPPELEELVAGGAPWETVSTAMLATVEISELAARSRLLRDLRRALTAAGDDDGAR
jgi:DNA-binding PadR family transcriptional regulator